jgi:hypothetical protein
VAAGRWAGPERQSFGGEEEGKQRPETKAGGRRNQSHIRETLVVKLGGVWWAGGTASTMGGSQPMGGAREAKLRRRGGGEAEAGDQGRRKEEEEPVTH